jgi:hypothetical protein
VAELRSGGDAAAFPIPSGTERWDGEARMRSGITALAARPNPAQGAIA